MKYHLFLLIIDDKITKYPRYKILEKSEKIFICKLISPLYNHGIINRNLFLDRTNPRPFSLYRPSRRVYF